MLDFSINISFRSIVLAILVMLTGIIDGQTISDMKAYSAAYKFVESSNTSVEINETYSQRIEKDNATIGYVFGLNPRGFVLVSTQGNESRISGFSFVNDFEYTEQNIEIIEAFIGNKPSGHKKNSSLNPVDKTVGPFVLSLFGQVNCYDNDDKLINVSNLFTPNNYAPGCVAISLSTVLHYYQWPIIGMGSHTYSDKYGSSRGTYSVDYDKDTIDWSDIRAKYKYQQTTAKQREALGRLVYNSAVALDMDFEYNGSTSNINRIPNAGKKYFRFISKEVPSSSFIFWKVVDSNLVHKMPVIFSISASNGAGHSIVCDGIKFKDGKEFHHLNMGWWGNSNGWYDIKSGFNVGGYNKIDHAIINFLPVPMMNEPIISEDSSRLEINWAVSSKIVPDAYELQIKTDTSNWQKISDTLNSQSYFWNIDKKVKEYSFRIRSEIDSKWYPDSWSNIVEYKKHNTSTIDNIDNFIKIFPNPFKDKINIETKGKSRVILYSADGKVYIDENINQNCIIPTENLKRGIYIIKILKGTKSYFTKLVKID